jgi:chaperonin GroES
VGKIDFQQKLLDDFVVVQMQVELSSRIKLPDWERILRGVVIAVGPGKMLPNGQRAPMECKLGDTVSFAATAGMDSSYGARVSVRMLHDADIDAVIEEAA